jgi:hypothetical protein
MRPNENLTTWLTTPPFGRVLISVIDSNHVCLDFETFYPLTVRGRMVHGMLHLWRQADGTFGPDGRRCGGFLDSFNLRDLEETERARVLNALVCAVTAWARENCARFEAADAQCEAEAHTVREEIGQLEETLRQKREALALLERRAAQRKATRDQIA